MNRFKKQAHCTYCGHKFKAGQPWPRRCAGCQKISFINPLPVAVMLVPVDKGLLLVRRGIKPQKGKLALPGGFIELGESWQEAGARELHEETNLNLSPDTIREFSICSDPAGYLLVFGLAPPQKSANLPPFIPSVEVAERLTQSTPINLAFPLHTAAMQQFFNYRHKH